MRKPVLRRLRPLVGLGVLAWAGWYLAGTVSGTDLGVVISDVATDPVGLSVALAAYAIAFGLRAAAWRRVLPALPLGQGWAAVHVSLLGNHVLPLRLGEALRPVSVARRTDIALADATASTLTMRALDLLAVLVLAMVVAPSIAMDVAGPVALGLAAGGVAVVLVVGLWWGRRLAALSTPDLPAVVLTLAAWVLEAVVIWQVAHAAGVSLSAYDAVAVTALTIAAQAVAVTPGGLGTYEAVATTALVGLAVDPGVAFAVALTTHAVKTGYAVAVGSVALCWPAPPFFGRWRLPREVSTRPPAHQVRPEDPVVVLMPVHDEGPVVGSVVRRVPRRVNGRAVVVVVVDDGSTDDSAQHAIIAGAHVVRHAHNRGLGAAVRTGLAEACAWSPAAVVYLDADGEYQPEQIEEVAAPVLSGAADYVVGSRFAGDIQRMQPHRRLGNVALTRVVRWLTRRHDITDGQSGFRAFSAAAVADAEIVHDYNYAQVLTLDLLAKGYVYTEVPITYAFRESGTSFVRLGRYLRRVGPAIRAELTSPPAPQSSTTWVANRARASLHARSSREPSARSAATAS